MDSFPPEAQDEFSGGKGKKKKKEPKPKGPGKGKGKAKKEPMMDFGPLIQPPPPPFGAPGPMSHEIYDFQDLPPEIPEKKPKKPRYEIHIYSSISFQRQIEKNRNTF